MLIDKGFEFFSMKTFKEKKHTISSYETRLRHLKPLHLGEKWFREDILFRYLIPEYL